MKLAEALNLRADTQMRISQLRERINNNMKVQEGDKPAEQPSALFAELDDLLINLRDLIVRINITNTKTDIDGITMTELLARKDVMKMQLDAYRFHCQAQYGSQAHNSFFKMHSHFMLTVTYFL